MSTSSGNHTLAIGTDGGVYAWGVGSNGQLGNGTTTASVTEPVTVTVSWGANTRIEKVATGNSHSLALDEDGKVWAWGNGSNGQLGNGGTASSSVPVAVNLNRVGAKIIAIDASENYSVALDEYGRVWTWGANESGQLGNGNTGTDQLTPVKVDMTNMTVPIKAIAAGSSHVLALDEDSKVWAWGNGGNGQLGNNSTDNSNVPVEVNTGNMSTGITDIVAGSEFSAALDEDGKVWTWGYGAYGQLGNGDTASSSVPVAAINTGTTELKVVSIAAGDSHVLALGNDGKVWAWGYNADGQLGDGTTTDSSTPTEMVRTSYANAYSKVIARGNTSIIVDKEGEIFVNGIQM